VRTLSPKSLRWRGAVGHEDMGHFTEIAEKLRHFMGKVDFFKNREDLHHKTIPLKKKLHDFIRDECATEPGFEKITGLALSASCPLTDIDRDNMGRPKFEVHSLRASRRVSPDGGKLNQMIVSITQKRTIQLDGGPSVPSEDEDGPGAFVFRGGCTLIFDLDSLELLYAIRKSISDDERLKRHLHFRTVAANSSLRATYFSGLKVDEPFAVMHRGL